MQIERQRQREFRRAMRTSVAQVVVDRDAIQIQGNDAIQIQRIVGQLSARYEAE